MIFITTFFSKWINIFRPNLFVSNLFEISVDALVENKIRLVILDLDNTLAPTFAKKPTMYALNFIRKLKQKNLTVIIVSNNTRYRVENFCCQIPELTDYLWLAYKPFIKKIKNMLEKYKVGYDQIIMIGDQFITDIWVANRLKIKSILVTSLFELAINPIKPRSTFVQLIEKYIYSRLQQKNMLNKLDLSNIILGTDDEIL